MDVFRVLTDKGSFDVPFELPELGTIVPYAQLNRQAPPGHAIFAAYTAYKFKFNDVPADYSEIYVYGDESLKGRFPPNKGVSNLFVLKKDNMIEKYGKTKKTNTLAKMPFE